MPINRYRRFHFDSPIPGRTFAFPDATELGYSIDGDPDSAEGLTARDEVIPRDHPLSVQWRGWIGTFIKDNLNEPLDKPWHLYDFPKHYTLIRRPRLRNPNRYDPYLYGYGGKKNFRSPQEFAFHAVWLFHREYHEMCKCECVLCTGRSQGSIEAIWVGIPGMPEPNPEDAPEPPGGGYPPRNQNGPRIKQATRTTTTTYTLLHASVIDGKSRYPDEFTPEHIADLTLARPYRIGEIVWVKIDPLVSAHRRDMSEDNAIRFWPGLLVIPDGTSPYRVQLFGVRSSDMRPVRFDHILSWRAYCLPETIVEQLQDPPIPQGAEDPLLEFAAFQPIPFTPKASTTKVSPRTYENALGPLALAIGKANWIEERYNLTNHFWDFDSKVGLTECYHGLWWGAERIWVGDMVRLKFYRTELETWLGEGNLQADLLQPSKGAGGRQVLARIISFTFDIAKQETCFHAELYELEDPNDNGLPGTAPERTSQRGFPIPRPPLGYRFRMITPEDGAIYLPLFFISGRLDTIPTESRRHQALLPNVVTAANLRRLRDEEDAEDDALGRLKDVLALAGLHQENGERISPTFRFQDKKGHRRAMLDAADRDVRTAMRARLQERDRNHQA